VGGKTWQLNPKYLSRSRANVSSLLSTKAFLKLLVSTRSCKRQISDWLMEAGTLYQMYLGVP